MRKWLIIGIGVHIILFLLAEQFVAAAVLLAVLYHHAFTGVK